MKVLHVITTLDPDGAQRVALELCARTPGSGRIVALRTGSGRLASLASVRNVAVESLGSSRWNPRVFRRLRRNVDSTRPDVIHTHLPFASFVGRSVGRDVSLPVVSSLHGMPDKRRPDFTWMERSTADIPERVVAVSERMRRDAIRIYRFSPERVHVIPNGIDVDRFRSGGERRDIDVLFVGRLTNVKGLDLVLPGLGAVARSRPLRVVAVGEGPARATWAALAERVGVSIEWIGFTEHPEEWFRRAKVCVVPSRSEAFGLAAVEALAAGCDVLHSGVDALPDVCGEFGGVLPEDPDRVAGMVLERVDGFCENQARTEWVERRYSVDAMCRAHERMYASCTASVGSRQ